MKTVIFTVLLVAALVQSAWALSDAKIIDPEWPEETTYEFAILDQQGNRRATAYYRILQEESMGRPTYRIKYVGRNEDMQESTECVVFRETLKPLGSTRKVVSGGMTLFYDVAYGDNEVVVRKKYEGQEIEEKTFAVNRNVFDYEELMWLIPQLDFSQDNQLTFTLFSTLIEIKSTVIVSFVGKQPLEVNNHTFDATLYTFNMNMTPYMVYTVMQDGKPVPARVDMGSTTFLNLRLDSSKTGEKPSIDKPEEKPEEKPETPPSDNPLGLPPAGSRY